MKDDDDFTISVPERVKELSCLALGGVETGHVFLDDTGEKELDQLDQNGWFVCGNYYSGVTLRLKDGVLTRVDK